MGGRGAIVIDAFPTAFHQIGLTNFSVSGFSVIQNSVYPLTIILPMGDRLMTWVADNECFSSLMILTIFVQL